MFRKIAMALVAASVLAAPALAQNNAPGETKAAPTAPAPTTENVVKPSKAITKHHVVVRHHRHGTKVVKFTKSGKHVHHKYGKYTRHISHGGITAKQLTGARGSAKPVPSKPVPSKPAAAPSLD
jgi:hypothetical protein